MQLVALIWTAIKDIIGDLGKLEWTVRLDSSVNFLIWWLYSVYKCVLFVEEHTLVFGGDETCQ